MTSAGPWEGRRNDIRPRKRRLKWWCVTSLEDGDGDRGDGPAALAITWAGYPGHGPAAYAPPILAPQSVGDAAHSSCEVYQVMHLTSSVEMEGCGPCEGECTGD